MDREPVANGIRRDTAALLTQHQSEVTHVWEERCRRQLPAAVALDRAVLLDSLEVIIENLCMVLRNPAGAGAEICYDNVCAEHGRTRAGVPGFSLEQAISEYRILREAIFQVLQKYAPLPNEERELMSRAIDQAIEVLSTAYVKASSKPNGEEVNETSLVRGMTRASRSFAVIASGIAGLSLLGWILGTELFFTWLPGLTPMSIVTSIILLAASGALWLLRRDNLPQPRRVAGFVLAGAVAWMCVLNLISPQTIQAYNSTLQSWMDFEAPPARMSLVTSVGLLLIGIALLFSDWRHRWGIRSSQWLALVAGSLSAWALIDYVYGFIDRNITSNTAVSLPTALALFLVSLGVLFAHPARGPVSVLASRRAGGFIARRVILASLFLPLIVGFIRLVAERSGLVTNTMGTAAVVVMSMLVFSALVLWSAKALNQMEFQRDRYFEEAQGALLRRDQLSADLRLMETERKRREDFVAMLSHDLRGPLSAAKTSAQLGLRHPDRQESHGSLFQRINNNLTRIDHMIRDLLDANRLRAGEPLPIRVSECDLAALLRDTLEELTVIHGDRFRLEAPREVSGYWASDSIVRIVENLCNNAVKYGAPGREIDVRLTAAPDEVRIGVRNFGDPIPAEQQARIFEPFHRTRGATDSGQTGWGLGLALVRGLAESHRGRVEVSSAPLEGTTFTVVLPRDARPAETHPMAPSQA